ncbi:hypothetical protein [Algoriphagus marincola]|uniref:hypothetical protein n=1 Tax=Algoriphagus marincola TaxID=264027 RepID=UPI0012DFB4FF|nr:hypothetical protein [Algoriphagus marincola]
MSPTFEYELSKEKSDSIKKFAEEIIELSKKRAVDYAIQFSGSKEISPNIFFKQAENIEITNLDIVNRSVSSHSRNILREISIRNLNKEDVREVLFDYEKYATNGNLKSSGSFIVDKFSEIGLVDFGVSHFYRLKSGRTESISTDIIKDFPEFREGETLILKINSIKIIDEEALKKQREERERRRLDYFNGDEFF